MDMHEGRLAVDPFLTITIGILVLFVGKDLKKRVRLLRELSIPEPVIGGLLASIALAAVYSLSGVSVDFELTARDVLLVYFFTTIGINASLRDLVSGGRTLVLLLSITVGYMVLQNLVGMAVAYSTGLPVQVGVIGGTISLIGGYGTAIAWAPRVAEAHGIENAMEIGIACATFGLILASIQGGPIANFLISRHGLEPEESSEPDVGIAESQESTALDYFDVLHAVLAIHLCIILGLILHDLLEGFGVPLPEFVPCLLSGIVLSNLGRSGWPRIGGRNWPSRTPAIALLADISLGSFLAMSLMSLQLWTLLDLAGPIVGILTAQLVVAITVNLFVVFPALGKNYDAAVIASGFGGISLGSTPTAMANMSAVTKRHGGSHVAFIVVPLVCAFFIDIVNAAMIPFFVSAF
ncbi:MAG: sodium/glutamate symporter [Bythopirellula sp.]